MTDDLASRMYAHAEQPDRGPVRTPAAVPAPSPATDPALVSPPPPGAAPSRRSEAGPEVAADSLVEDEADESESLGDRLYDGGEPPADGNYSPLLRDAFDRLEVEEREDAEHLEAIAQGRQQVHEALAELGVGTAATRELTATFSGYRREPLPDDALSELGHRTEVALREQWGKHYDRNVAYARTAFDAALKRAPWLAQEVDSGAGNDAAVVRHFATIGRRMARAKK